MSRAWIAVASAEHVRRGVAGGFAQVCHGRAAPLRRLAPGDAIAYYSPTSSFRGRDALRAFTAVGTVRDGAPYAFDMGGGFVPFRRDVDWLDAVPTPIAPLLPRLSFAAGTRHWGARLRFGLLEVDPGDLVVVRDAMRPRGTGG
ncbi:MAG: EVE domain-containing protein [Burkholderiaceae bacterium]|jgi:hypothetical protein|nr:EVE domain-containing protein [Burkholderiales bacterium]MCZ8098426.1 EVE domain-containing protein [Burkholderiales bacterium]MCZ8337186.1 EVE domain-containing protein [Burkholderiaceae bacterium]